MKILLKVKNGNNLFVNELFDSFESALERATKEFDDKDLGGRSYNHSSIFTIRVATARQIKLIENDEARNREESNRIARGIIPF